ncbi:MAG: NADH-quinone oxidoreductase subunit F, partial [Bacteroidota bacterium]
MKNNHSDSVKNFLIKDILLNPQRDGNVEFQKKLSFISRERLEKPFIYVGYTSCSIPAGAKKTYQAILSYLEDHDLEIEVVKGGCNGYCKAEPVVDVQLPGKARISFKNITHDKVSLFLDDILNNNVPAEMVLGQFKNDIHQKWDGVPYIDEIPYYSHQKRILMENCGVIDPVSVSEYIARGGYQSFSDTIMKLTPAQVCDIVEDSMLLGRGGGAFNAGKKWKISLNTISDQKYFICNAVESDPGSYMNRVMMESDPHKLIEAILIASYAIGASKAFIFTRSEFSMSIERLREAINQAKEYGIIGHNIFDSGVNIDVIVKEGARAFVCGEETALINSIEGKRAMPVSKPPYPAIRGHLNKPTSVNNAETLLSIPLIMKNGKDWFRSLGNQKSKGTKLFTLSGKVKNYGTIEVEMGTPFSYIVEKIGGG